MGLTNDGGRGERAAAPGIESLGAAAAPGTLRKQLAFKNEQLKQFQVAVNDAQTLLDEKPSETK
ncbi:hypothetical protein GQ600_15580 [Phytophthora cactorum]|nr:hypothetical protein GQ600_15580 [Phytophthora cactorum]